MRRILRVPGLALALVCGGSSVVDAQTSSITAIADTFVSSANPANNYGGAGGLAISAGNLPKGEFDSVILFDLSATKAAFDAEYGAGNWTIQSITLALNATAPRNPIYNGSSDVPPSNTAGQFNITWMQNTSWVEGIGTPSSSSTSGLTFNNLPNYLSNADQSLGSFTYDGSPNGYAYSTYTLGLSRGLTASVYSGAEVSLELTPADSMVSYVFNSHNDSDTTGPVLTVTAVAGAPGAAATDTPTMPAWGLAALGLLLLLLGGKRLSRSLELGS